VRGQMGNHAVVPSRCFRAVAKVIDPSVALGAVFVRVVGLVDRPERLPRPDRALRVWWVNQRHLAMPAHSETSNLKATSR
jgi:hypothetical protein